MSTPIGPQKPFEKEFRVERVDEEKLTKDQKERTPGKEVPTEKLGVAAFLLEVFRDVVDFFVESKEAAKSVEKGARENLLLFKEALETLKKEDRSQDAQFLNGLSQIWLHLLEDAIHFKKDETSLKFRDLIRVIQHYPENQPHTLGYYLSEYAGQKWIPFPYMELIQKIHKDHEKNPTVSPLASWSIRIDELVALLQVQ